MTTDDGSPDTSGADAATGRAERFIDNSVPHSARMYDYWLGGKENFAADRELGDAIIRVLPTIKRMARENRGFMHRAARYLAEQGIDQFLDIGTGIPTSPNLHETAQETNPAARVVYVDKDPIVLVHARALMVNTPEGRTAYIDGDLADPQGILSDRAFGEVIDLDRPVALTLIAVLMLLTDEQRPWDCVSTLMDALPRGSYVAIGHPGLDFDVDAMTKLAETSAEAGFTVVPRVRDEVARFFGDWELVEPGIVPVNAWRPNIEPADPNATFAWAGVARKP